MAQATVLPTRRELIERQRERDDAAAAAAAAEPEPAPTAPAAPAAPVAPSGSGPQVAPRVRAFADKNQARKVVLASMFALLVIAVYRAKKPENDVNLYRRVWGTAVLGLFLSLIADFAPSIAGPFAILTVLGSLTNGGDKAIQNALSGLSSKVPSPSASSGTATLSVPGVVTGTVPAPASIPWTVPVPTNVPRTKNTIPGTIPIVSGGP